MVESGGLENRCVGNPCTEGSNPSPSAFLLHLWSSGGEQADGHGGESESGELRPSDALGQERAGEQDGAGGIERRDHRDDRKVCRRVPR